MPNPLSKITAQGQISVPAEVRKKLGLGPGAVVEWVEEADGYRVRRKGKYTWDDIRKTLFPVPPKPVSVREMDEAIRKYIRRKHARR